MQFIFTFRLKMAFPCSHKTHGPFDDIDSIISSSLLSSSSMRVRTFHVRSNANLPWQQVWLAVFEKQDHRYFAISTRHNLTTQPYFCYPVVGSNVDNLETLLIDEIDKKLYLIRFPLNGRNYFIGEVSMEIMAEVDGDRAFINPHSSRFYVGEIDFKIEELTKLKTTGLDSLFRSTVADTWFLNQFDGSIFQLFSYSKFQIIGTGPLTCSHTVSWLKLEIEASSGINYVGKVKVMAQYKLEFDKHNIPDRSIVFSKDGKTLVLLFRYPDFQSVIGTVSKLGDSATEEAKQINTSMDPDSRYVEQLTKLPVYAVFGLDYHSHSVELLTQFDPSSYEHHCDLLVSSRLLSTFGTYIGLPNSLAISFLSQRMLMIGHFMKYTFFCGTHKKKMTVLAVKSLVKTLLNKNFSLTPKKLWFPLEDDEKFKDAYEKSSHSHPNKLKWDLLTEKDNIIVVAGREFVIQVLDRRGTILEPFGTVRVKLSDEYKDYRKCAGCGKLEEFKRRSKNGKRMSQFKVCGWCKDDNLHKLWWERPCHYCSEKCADDHWPMHQLEHEQPIKFKISKEKKKKKKK